MKKIIFILAISAFAFSQGFCQQKFEAYGKTTRISLKPKDISPPKIEINYGETADSTKEHIVVIVEDSGGEVKLVKINDKIFPFSGKEMVKIESDFMPGDELTVTANDASNNSSEKTFSVRQRIVAPVQPAAPVSVAVQSPILVAGAIQLGTEYVSKIPRFVALVMGVSQYKYAGQGLPALDNPVKDAQKIYAMLTREYNFDSTASKLLKSPTRQEVIDAFEGMAAELNDNDNFLVFYAGHGFYDKPKEFGFWLPSDAKITTRSDWISNSQIKEYMSAIPSKHTLLITDACFGGSIFKTRAVDAMTILKIHALYKDPSKKAITSGSLEPVPDKSIFLDQLLKKLSENEDEYLPSHKLFNRIYEPVSNNASEPQFGVIQGAGDEGGDFIFIKKIKK